MMTNTPSKQQLNSKSNELQDRLDKLIASIVREYDLESTMGITQLKKAKALCEDLNNLEPAINALGKNDCLTSNTKFH